MTYINRNDDLDRLDVATLKIDKIYLDDKAIVRFRKKWVWVVSFFIIIIIVCITILLAITPMSMLVYALYFAVFNPSTRYYSLLSDLTNIIKSFWHIYLISLISLTTMLSGFIYLNRSTWIESKIDKNENLFEEFLKYRDLFSKSDKD